MLDIPKQVSEIWEDENEIPNSVAELDQETEAPEGKPYVISFSKYNEKMCEITELGKNKGNRALSILKKIGMNVYSRADFSRNKIETKSVANSGGYSPLYNGLGNDVEVREMFLQSTGRIFYFDIEPERAMYIVAIRENHLETNKVRR